jgi:hypothetical protein
VTSRLPRAAFGLALLVHLVVLYAPRAPAAPGPVWLDKVVHVTIFAAVALTAARAGLRRGPVLLALAAHALVSELLQWQLLPDRSGDPWDAVADLAGVVAGWAGAGRLGWWPVGWSGGGPDAPACPVSPDPGDDSPPGRG